jgi:hypothetical protein
MGAVCAAGPPLCGRCLNLTLAADLSKYTPASRCAAPRRLSRSIAKARSAEENSSAYSSVPESSVNSHFDPGGAGRSVFAPTNPCGSAASAEYRGVQVFRRNPQQPDDVDQVRFARGIRTNQDIQRFERELHILEAQDILQPDRFEEARHTIIVRAIEI